MLSKSDYEVLTYELYDLSDAAITEHIAAARTAVACADSVEREMCVFPTKSVSRFHLLFGNPDSTRNCADFHGF